MTSTITITPTHNDYRLSGSLNHLNQGAGTPGIRIYGGERPALATDVPGSAMLVEIPLTKPAGVVASNVLTITPAGPGLIGNTGIATWARFVNGDGETCFDAKAGQGEPPEGQFWEVRLQQTQLYAGGEVSLLSCVLG